MPAFKDITGRRFGRLVAKIITTKRIGRFPVWECDCDCGMQKLISSFSLLYNGTKSCGCLVKRTNSLRSSTHRMSKTPTYKSWAHMHDRCLNKKSKKWSRYGGRGIAICARWRNSFESFLADMGVKPSGTTLDRINNDGNYEPGNCRWATARQQANNTRRNRKIRAFGKNQSIATWAREIGRHRTTIERRVDRGLRGEHVLYDGKYSRR